MYRELDELAAEEEMMSHRFGEGDSKRGGPGFDNFNN